MVNSHKVDLVFYQLIVMRVILFGLAFFISGCTFFVPDRIKKNFKYCFDGKRTDTLININGYYRPESKVYETLIFYDNGFVHVGPDIAYLSENEKISFTRKRWGGDFGRYILCNDTIKFQDVNPPGEMSRSMSEIWFKIIDRNTMQKIYSGTGEGIVSGKLPPLNPYFEKTFVFRPFEIRMKPEDTWIFKKRWFHCKKK